MNSPRFILSGGGTGGHIYPAIAIADELKRRHPNAAILFVGAADKMEMQKVPAAGYPIQGLWIAGLQRRLSWKNMIFPFKLLSSLLRANKIINRFKPTVVIGTGGFASGPLLQMAYYKRIPIVIQEQNSFPGITNKLLGSKAAKICVAYEGLQRYFPAEKLVLTGNPVRQDLFAIEGKRAEGIQYFALDNTKLTVLVLGGSLGARRINQLMAQQIDAGLFHAVQVIWQCGKGYYAHYQKWGDRHIRVMPFIEKMDYAYAVADVIISRAGASSVSELCLVGKPVIFIPSPTVAEDHQTKNAQAIANKAAAVVVPEQELEKRFAIEFLKLIQDEQQRVAFGEAIKLEARPNATQDIVAEIEKLIKA